jgi:hypothetical protein
VYLGHIFKYPPDGTYGLIGRSFPEHFVVESADFVAPERHELREVVLLRRIAFQPVGFLRDEYFHIRRIVPL